MTVTQTVDIPADRRITIRLEVPVERTITTFFPARETTLHNAQKTPFRYANVSLPEVNARTVEEALQMAAEKAAAPNRKPISQFLERIRGFSIFKIK